MRHYSLRCLPVETEAVDGTKPVEKLNDVVALVAAGAPKDKPVPKDVAAVVAGKLLPRLNCGADAVVAAAANVE